MAINYGRPLAVTPFSGTTSKRQKQSNSYLTPLPIGEMDEAALTQEANDGTTQDEGTSAVYDEIVPARNDVLLTRRLHQ